MPDPVSPAAYVADIAGPYTPVVTKAIAVAALGILGEVADGRDSQTVSLMSDAGTDHCLTMAKLNLYQCLAVAGPHYEDVFCMGQHAIKDTGQCLILAAGAPIPPDVLAERAKQAAIARDAAMKIPTLAEAAAAKASSGARRKKGR